MNKQESGTNPEGKSKRRAEIVEDVVVDNETGQSEDVVNRSKTALAGTI
jgi:hypothetical protein